MNIKAMEHKNASILWEWLPFTIDPLASQFMLLSLGSSPVIHSKSISAQ